MFSIASIAATPPAPATPAAPAWAWLSPRPSLKRQAAQSPSPASPTPISPTRAPPLPSACPSPNKFPVAGEASTSRLRLQIDQQLVRPHLPVLRVRLRSMLGDLVRQFSLHQRLLVAMLPRQRLRPHKVRDAKPPAGWR